ncbi:MAG: Rossmann-like and DUF2520 domain-containing protein [Flavobacteriales bacterium]
MIKYKINFIGSGNVAHFLAKAFHRFGHEISGVHSPNISHSENLAHKVKAAAFKSLDELPPVDIIFIAIRDEHIKNVASQLISRKELIAHTSGSVSIDTLDGCLRRAVFYPFQTITQDSNARDFPVLIESRSNADKALLKELALCIAKNIAEMSSEQRRGLHLAAVFANNFVNHINSIALALCKKHHINPELLQPLAKQTAQNFLKAGNMQTGPAARFDKETIEKQLGLLKDSPEFSELYELITLQIQNKKHE